MGLFGTDIMQLNVHFNGNKAYLKIGALCIYGLAVKYPCHVGLLTRSRTGVADPIQGDREILRGVPQLLGTILPHVATVTGTGLYRENMQFHIKFSLLFFLKTYRIIKFVQQKSFEK